MKATCAALLVLAACGSSGSGGNGTGDGDSAGACDDECIEGFYIFEHPNTCDMYCTLTPQPRECVQSDCESVRLYDFEVDGTYRMIFATHSPSRREMTVLFVSDTRSWQVTGECVMKLADTDPGQAIECSDSGIERGSGGFEPSPPSLRSVAEPIEDTASCPCEISY